MQIFDATSYVMNKISLGWGLEIHVWKSFSGDSQAQPCLRTNPQGVLHLHVKGIELEGIYQLFWEKGRMEIFVVPVARTNFDVYVIVNHMCI